MVGADTPQRLGEAREVMVAHTLHAKLESGDTAGVECGFQSVGKVAADVLRTDQVQLARMLALGRAPRRDGRPMLEVVESLPASAPRLVDLRRIAA